MDLHHIRTFLTVYEKRSISAAADTLDSSQPALSKAIRRLEESLGVKLFERLPRGVEPTIYGRTLAHFARAVDSNYRSALRQIEALRNAAAGEIAIGAGGTWREGPLPVAIARLIARRPLARVRVVVGTPEELVATLLRGEFDLILTPVGVGEIDAAALEARTLLRNDLVVAARADHPLAALDRVDPETLAEQRWVLPGGSHIRERFDRMFRQRGISPPVPSVEVEDATCLFEIVEHGDLLTYVSTLRLASRPGRFSRIAAPDLVASRDTGLLRRRASLQPPLAVELERELDRVLAEAPYAAFTPTG